MTIDRDTPWSGEERVKGAAVAELALRMADGKPTVPAPPWTKEMSDLNRAVATAEDVASQPGAGDGDRSLATALRRQFDDVTEAAAASAATWTPESYLEASVGNRVGVALAAAHECWLLLYRNPRDMVALEALGRLTSIARSLAREHASEPPR